DAAGVVVRSSCNEARPKNFQQAWFAGPNNRTLVLDFGVYDFRRFAQAIFPIVGDILGAPLIARALGT
ncbi:MAG: hypothetical protein K2X00_21385, partial [Nitrospiraceae bacterium]|nr:hypothetical protein [Nitrospiraceae bacterium]